MSLRLDHALIVDPSPDGPRILDDTSLYIEDGQIASLGQDLPDAHEVVDCRGCIVAPGLVNAHTHAAMVLMRGMADDLPLERWLEERIWPAEAKLTAETVRAGADLAIAEMLAGGTTAFADMYFFEEQVAQAADDAGIRCLAGFAIIGFDTPEFAADELIDQAEGFLDRWSAAEGRVRGSVAPHATYTCDGALLQETADLAGKGGHQLQTHCSETRHEVYSVEQDTGRRPVEQLAETGCLGHGSLLAHCGWITKAEVQEIARSGAAVVHNPVANMKLATGGYAPLPELLDAGVPVALGTDGAASNNRLDMFETMKTTALIHKHHRWEASILPAAEVLGLATRVGAQALGIEGGGRVTEGAPADLMVVDTSKPHLRPLNDPVSHLVYAAQPGDVRATIVAGKLLYKDGAFLAPGVDLEAIIETAEQAAAELKEA